ADRVMAVLAATAAQLGTEFMAPAPGADPVTSVVEMLGALSAAIARRLGGSCSPWLLAAALTGGRLLSPTGPDLVPDWVQSPNTSWLLAGGP
ncbi:MAG: hypothetical protein Q8P61_01295, partial [Candidatus Nanopelagicales bacterium]|nr:hypothetical protein [Candidatus Nanopelagicales bacterium]